MSVQTSDEVCHALAHNNLLRVFSNRDAVSRWAAIQETYHPNVVFYEPDDMVTGHKAVDAKAAALLDQREGWEFVPVGNVKRNHDMVYLAWRFGPPKISGQGQKHGGRSGGSSVDVDVKATGADVLMVREGKVEKFWVVLDGVSDVKV